VEEKVGKKGKKDDEDKGANSILSTIGAFFQPKTTPETDRQELLIQKVRKNGLESLTFSEQKFLQDSKADLSFLWDDPDLWWNQRVDSNSLIRK
jgi:hypothetical protein